MTIQLFTPNSISNGTIINGIANFYQTTKPTTRVDGSALVVGDRWYKIDDGTEWFWNGTYWLSVCQKTLSHPQLTNVSSTGFSFPDSIPSKGSVFIENVFCYSIVLTTNNNSDYWIVAVSICSTQNIGINVATFLTDQDNANQRLGKEVIANTVVASKFDTTESGLVLRLNWTKIGNPNFLYAAVSLNYRDIYL